MLFWFLQILKYIKKNKNLLCEINNYQKQIEDIKKSSQTLKDEIANSDNTDYIEKLPMSSWTSKSRAKKKYIFITPPAKTGRQCQTSKIFGLVWSGWLVAVLELDKKQILR